MMEIPEGKVSLLDAVPVRCGHITTEWEGECAVLAYPRFKYEWMRRFLLPKGMSPDIHVRLEEHGTAVWMDIVPCAKSSLYLPGTLGRKRIIFPGSPPT